MHAAVPTTILIASLVAISVILAGIASTIALARAQVERLDADLASAIRADYSADPHGRRLAPLDEQIIEATREDKERQDKPKQQPPGKDKPKQEPPDKENLKQQKPDKEKTEQ